MKSVTWQECFSLPESKVRMHTRHWQHIFKMVLISWLNKGKKAIFWVHSDFERSCCWNASLESLQALLLKLGASRPLTLAAAYTPETCALNFIALFPDGVAVLCVAWQCFFLMGNNQIFKTVPLIALSFSLSLFHTYTHTHTHTHTDYRFTHITCFSYRRFLCVCDPLKLHTDPQKIWTEGQWPFELQVHREHWDMDLFHVCKNHTTF